MLCFDIASNMEVEPFSQPVKGRPCKVEEKKNLWDYEGKTFRDRERNESWDWVFPQSLGAHPKKNSLVQTCLCPSLSDFEEGLGELTDSEEETLEGEITALQWELHRALLKEKTKGTSGKQNQPSPYPLSDTFRTPPAPPTWLGLEEATWGGNKCWPVVAPVMEIPHPNYPGQVICLQEPLAFKDLRQLEEAASQYSMQAPFTLSLMESFPALDLTPSDWQQLCSRGTL